MIKSNDRERKEMKHCYSIRPIELKIANAFITKYHRHHTRVVGHKFSIGLYLRGKLVGVAVCGRPVSRHLDDGTTIEVTRMCSDGTKNACSILYSACSRIAKEMGYDKIITYILSSETGVSLKASGWELELKKAGGKIWTGKYKGRNRTDTIIDLFGEIKKYPNELKQRWVKKLSRKEQKQQ